MADDVNGIPCAWLELDANEDDGGPIEAGEGSVASYPDGIAHCPALRAFRVRLARGDVADYYLPERRVSAWSYGYRGATLVKP